MVILIHDRKMNKEELYLFTYLKKNMKSILMLFFILIGFSSFSQNTEDADSSGAGKVAQLKIAYITRELNLTSTEAEKFWPLYNEMDAKLKVNRKAKKKLIKELNESNLPLKEDEIKKKLASIFDYETSEIALQKEYVNKIALVITYKKAAKLLDIEQEFRRELLKLLNQQKQLKNSPNGQKNMQGRPVKKK